jgi:hypothetical protein
MLDFFFFFIHAVGMFVLALLITNDPALIATNDTYFFYGLASLLALDIIWVSITFFLTTVRKMDKELPYYLWAPINIVTALVIVILVRNNLWGWLLPVMILRSVIDYLLSYKFYYPPDPPDPPVVVGN